MISVQVAALSGFVVLTLLIEIPLALVIIIRLQPGFQWGLQLCFVVFLFRTLLSQTRSDFVKL